MARHVVGTSPRRAPSRGSDTIVQPDDAQPLGEIAREIPVTATNLTGNVGISAPPANQAPAHDHSDVTVGAGVSGGAQQTVTDRIHIGFTDAQNADVPHITLVPRVELCGMRRGIPEPFVCYSRCTTEVVCDYLGLCAQAERIETEGLVR